MTPELWPVWCCATAGCLSTTSTLAPGRRSVISRATARPTIPAPKMATPNLSAAIARLSRLSARLFGDGAGPRGRPPAACRGKRGQQLVADVRGRDPGDLRVVVAGRDLDDVRADQLERGERAEHAEQFAAGQAAGLRRSRAWGVRRVEHVDVDGDVRRAVTDPLGDALGHPGDAEPVGLRRGDQLEADVGIPGEVGTREQRSPDPDVNAARRVEQALLEGAPEWRAMGVSGAEVRVPGVQVRVEVDHGDRAVR